MTVSPVTSRSLPIALAFVAGFVDTCGFVALAGLFSAHVTGNFVLLGASLVLPHAGELAKLLALPVFVVAVAATRVCLIHWGESRGAVRGVLAAELVFLGVFLVLGVAISPILNADATLTILTGMAAVFAMGVQNAASRTIFSTLSPTTVMTGNVTQIVLDLVDFAATRDLVERKSARARFEKFGPPIVGFAIGAGAGAWGFGAVGFWCVLLPITVIGWLLARMSP